jgi:predicted AAA+ superfamily ATPase
VAGELQRQSTWSQTTFDLFHFRDRNGLEVDLVIEDTARNIAGIEVKASATVEARDFSGLTFLRDKTGARFTLGAVLYTGRESVRFGERLWALPLSALWT